LSEEREVAEESMTRLLGAVSGMIAWAAQFTVIYGVTSIACERGYGDASWFGIVPLTIIVTTLLALSSTGFVLLRAVRERRHGGAEADPTDRFLNETTLVVSGLSLVAILWQGLPALIVPACG
jgi:hypothetical protein